MYYFKDKDNGVGISFNQNVIGDITWITKEEYDILVAEAEIARQKAEEEEKNAATEKDYEAALAQLGVE